MIMSELYPKHIALVMDGNGRWAEKRFLPRVAGHRKGVETARSVIQSCLDKKIQVLTLFAFSSENWHRPKAEVNVLMGLLKRLLVEEVSKLNDENVKLCVIGDPGRLPKDLQLAIVEAEALTENNSGLRLNIALNYGGRWDIVQAAKQLCSEVISGQLELSDVSESTFGSFMSLSELPEPDLLVRTSGEQRISNFLLWQLAYSEIYFTDTLWPDFSERDLLKALDFFAQRERRFGRTSQQVEQLNHA